MQAADGCENNADTQKKLYFTIKPEFKVYVYELLYISYEPLNVVLLSLSTVDLSTSKAGILILRSAS
jgi:hypothetical protein